MRQLPRRRLCCLLLLAPMSAMAISPAAAPQDNDFERLRAQLNAAGNPVDRAKAFPKFGEALVRQARTAAKAGDYERAEKILTEYRDTIRQLHEGLKSRVPNPEKSPGGFKQLQIHVRKTLHEVEDLVASVPANLQPPFEFLRKEIEKVDRGLIDDLFPRQPGREEKKGKS